MTTRFRGSRLLNTKPTWDCQLCGYKISSKRGMELHAKMSHGIETKLKGRSKTEAKDIIRKERKERVGVCSECGKDMSIHSKKNGNCP